MATVGSLVFNLSTNNRRFESGIGRARKSLTGFVANAGQSLQKLAGLTGKIGALAGIGGIGGLGAGLGFGVKMAAEAEQTEIAFTTLLGSSNKAKGVLSDLSKFAASTPFQLTELTGAGRQLAAFGYEANQIVPTLRQLGDLAAGTGQPIGELAEIFGKAKVQGRLFGEDINQLTGRGIPVIQEFAKQFGVAESEVKRLVSEGKVGFPELSKALQSMTGEGGRFAGLMEAQSGSLLGLWSTLKDNVSFALRDIGKMLIETFDFKAMLRGGVEFAKGIVGAVETMRPAFTAFVEFAKTAFDGIWSAGETIFTSVRGLVDSLTESFGMTAQTGQSAFGALGQSVNATMANSVSRVGSSMESIRDFVVDSALVGEFAFNNFGRIMSLVFNKALLGAVSFANDFAFFFTDQLPPLLEWFGRNWNDIWRTAIDGALTLLINFGKNARMLMTELWDFISSGGRDKIELSWTPLLDGLHNTIKELPDVPERAMTDFERNLTQDINRIGGKLESDLGDFMNRRRLELVPEIAASPVAQTAERLGAQSDAIAKSALSEESKHPTDQTPAFVDRRPTQGAGEALDARSDEAFQFVMSQIRGGSSAEDKMLKASEKTAKASEQAAKSLKRLERQSPAKEEVFDL